MSRPHPRPEDDQSAAEPRADRVTALRHLRWGWTGLLLFLTLGIVLEGLHALKIGWYLNPSNETRRLLWTLAHAHGTLLSLVHIAFAATVFIIGRPADRLVTAASRMLMGGLLLLPAGFFLGGVFIHAGDPGLPILLVPLGALMLLTGAVMGARLAFGSSARAD